MEKQIELSKELKLEIDVKEGKLLVMLAQEGAQGGAKLEGHISIDMLIDKLAEKIPGQIDDAIFAVLKQALKLV